MGAASARQVPVVDRAAYRIDRSLPRDAATRQAAGGPGRRAEFPLTDHGVLLAAVGRATLVAALPRTNRGFDFEVFQPERRSGIAYNLNKKAV